MKISQLEIKNFRKLKIVLLIFQIKLSLLVQIIVENVSYACFDVLLRQ
ncbi:Uncharacterised protein [Actinobacillus equuli]|nr:Uncharacterised protein [Actinobacillus equuli]